ncbi:MAG: polysaccharide biosynthesis protein [Clostridiales bacterium]|nr:polysaccharide biosynthesis protein [Clostridiales bacterium]
MSKKTFLQGAVILGGAGLIIKVLGAFFRIPLANIIGDTGMGYYQTAYPVYVLLLTLSTAGIPVAISRMVAERYATDNPYEAHRVFRTALWLLLGIGIVSFCILFFGAEAIVSALGNPGGAAAMKAVAPALLFVPLMAACRGYFQGMEDMGPTAASQVVEQLFRVVIGLALAVFLVTYGLEFAAAGASFGASAGAIGGLAAIWLIYLRRRKNILQKVRSDAKRTGESGKKILGTILVIAIPITIGAAIMPIMNAIDLAIVMWRLQQVGFSEAAANSLYGQLTGMAAPLINFPQVLTQAIAMSLVPTIAAAFKRQDGDFLRYNVNLGFRTALIIGLPCALGLMVLSEPIMLLLYPAQKASAVSAADCLTILAFGMIFLATVQSLTGVLQGIGKQVIPVINLAIGAVVKVILTYTLTGLPDYNIKGAAVGTAAAYVVAAVLNLMAVRRYTKVRINMKQAVAKPLVASVVMAVFAWLIYHGVFAVLDGRMRDSLVNAGSVGIAVIIAVVIYGVLLLATKTITIEEISKLPKGAKLARILRRFQR